MTAAARPVAGPPRAYSFPAVSRTRLDNGLDVIVAPVRRLPVCSVAIVADAGAELDRPGEEGAARLCARMLLEGTAASTALEITERLERIGASATADADWDAATLTLSVIAERLPEALSILAEVLTSPSFPVEELERLRDERLAELAQLRTEPRGLADEVFAGVVYASGSRYGAPLGGDETAVRELSRDALVRHHESAYAPARTCVIVAGDVSTEAAVSMVEASFAKWKAVGAAPAARRGVQAPDGSRVHLVERAGAPQSEIRIGKPGVPRTHRDYFPLVVMNSVFGGVFSSRINLNLRERHAYTYGAHSSFEWRRGNGPFTIQTAVESGVTAAAVREVLTEMDRIRAERVTADELSLVLDYLAGVFPIRFETSSAIAAALAQAFIHDLPADYYDRYRERVTEVTADDVLRVARSHLDPREARIVIVGDATRVRGELAAFGRVETISVD